MPALAYRKKPVVIHAIQWTGSNLQEILDFAAPRAFASNPYTSTILIDTLEGQMKADKNDWIIRGVKGEYYPCKPDIFAATYEQIMDIGLGITTLLEVK